MAETDPVRIAVDIIDNFSDEFVKIKSLIQSVDSSRADVEVDFDVIESSLAKVEAARQAAGRDVTVGVNLKRSMLGFGVSQALFRGMGGIMPGGGARGGIFAGGGISRTIGDLQDEWKRLGKTLVSYRPSIMDWWNVLALLIPILITLAGAAVGVIAGFAGIATAAAGVIGLGLLGWGDSFSESLQNVTRQARELGSELFQVLRPAALEMQPILEDAFSALPGMVNEIVDELSALSGFRSGLGRLGTGFMEWIESSLQLINLWRDEIVHVVDVVGGALGAFIQDFLVFGLREVIKNEEAYAQLVDIFFDFFRTLFEISKAVTFTVAQFGFLFDAASAVARFLSNRWTVALLTFATATFLGVGALLSMAGALVGAEGSGLLSMMGSLVSIIRASTMRMWGFVTATWAEVAALSALQKSLLALGAIGVLALGTGLAVQAFTGTGGSSRVGGGTTVNNLTVNGDVGRREMHQIKDWIGPEHSSMNARGTSSEIP